MPRVRVLGGILGVAWVGCSLETGCARRRASFDDDDPASQLAALDRAVETNDRSNVPDMIRLLDSDDPAVRMFAILGLERMTGQTHGYDFAASEPERDAAADRWVAWYNSESGADQPIREGAAGGAGAAAGDAREGGVGGV